MSEDSLVSDSISEDSPLPEPAKQMMQGPLSGLRVLDLSGVVSGPMAAMVLADQGADVIKVEPPGWGDGIRYLGATNQGVSAIFCMINRNKRSIAIDWKQPAGADLVHKLADRSDVVLQNYRPGKLAKIGLGYDALSQTNPELVYASVSGMGETGPYAHQKVYDYVIQGITGITDVQGRVQPEMVRTIMYDKVTSLTVAQGITAALLARERGAGGQHIKISMLDAGLQFNWPELMWNHSFLDGASTLQLSGDLADMYEVNRTADGAIVSHGLGGDVSSYDTEQLIGLFAENDVPVSRANRREDVVNDPQVQATGALQMHQHPRAGRVLQPRSAVRFADASSQVVRPAPEVGEHTLEILDELGLDEAAMQELAEQGVLG